MATSKERQASFRKRMEAAGYVQVTGWVHETNAAEIAAVMHRLRDPDLEVSALRSKRTGRMMKK